MTVNQWDRARMDAGISNPGWPHDAILHCGERLHCNTTRDGTGFDDLPEKDRAHWLERAARITVPNDHVLHPEYTAEAA